MFGLVMHGVAHASLQNCILGSTRMSMFTLAFHFIAYGRREPIENNRSLEIVHRTLTSTAPTVRQAAQGMCAEALRQISCSSSPPLSWS